MLFVVDHQIQNKKIINLLFKFLKINVELLSKIPTLKNQTFQVFVILHLILFLPQHANNNLSLTILHYPLFSQYFKDIMEQFLLMVRQVRVKRIQCKVGKVIKEVSSRVLFVTFSRQFKAQLIPKSISFVQHFYNCTISSLLTCSLTQKKESKKNSFKFTNVQARV